jgi:hypothetical protein
MKKGKRTEEEEKEIKQKTRLVFDTIRLTSEITRPVPVPDIRVQAGYVEKKVLVLPRPYQKELIKKRKNYLTGKLERSTKVVRNKESEILSVVNKSLQAT